MSNTEESRPVELKATKAKTYKALVNKFVKSVGELSIELSRQKRKPRVSREDVYQALYLFLGERPATKPKMQFLVERRRLVARAYARNCRARRELRETIIRAALTATFQRGDETERSVDCDPAEESTMEVDRSSRSDSPKSTNTVEMRSVGSTESNDLSAAVSSPKDSASEENGHSAGSNSKLSLNMDSASEKNGHSAESVSAAAFDENPKDTDADESAIQSLEGTGDEIDDKFSSRFSLEEAESLPDDNPESTNSGKDMGIEFENVPEKETGARARRKSEGDLPRPTEVDPVDQIATKLAGAGILTEPETPLPRSSKLVSKERPATLRTRTSDPPETPRVSAAPQTPPQASTSRKKRHESDYNEAYAAFIPHLGSPVTPPPGNRSPTERVMPSERMPEDLENVAGPSGIGRTRSPNTPPRESRLSRERSSPRRRVVHPEEGAAGLLENRGRSPTTPPHGIRSPRKRSRSTESTTDSSVTVASPSKKSPVTLRKHSSPSQAGGQNDDLGTPKPRRRLCDPEVTDSSSAEEATDS